MIKKQIHASGYIHFSLNESSKVRRYSTRMLSHYDILKIAIPHYDRIQNNLAMVVKKNVKGKAVRVLDMGCGTGLTAFAILKFAKNVHITAVDSEKVMIKQAADRLKAYIRQGNVRLVRAEGRQFMEKTKPGAYYVFASALTLHNFKKSLRRQFIKEAYRILEPGGIFVNADKYVSDKPNQHKKDLKYQLACFDQFDRLHLPAVKKEWVRHYLRDMKKDKIMRINESLLELQKIGFRKPKQIYRKHMFSVVMAIK